jgi:acetyl-CoA synthetase (ADP-forming)
LIAVKLASQKALTDAFAMIAERAGKEYDGAFLVQEMVSGAREIMIGMHRDASFGPSVAFGLGGIFTEILQDVVFRIAPLRKRDARDMMRGIRAHKILDAVRGMPKVDQDVLSTALMAVGQIALDHPEIAEIDINPLIIRGNKPIAVDALVVLTDAAG